MQFILRTFVRILDAQVEDTGTYRCVTSQKYTGSNELNVTVRGQDDPPRLQWTRKLWFDLEENAMYFNVNFLDWMNVI